MPFDEQRLLEDFIVRECDREGWGVDILRHSTYVREPGRRSRRVDRMEIDITVDDETVTYETVFVGVGLRNRLKLIVDSRRIDAVDKVIATWNRNAENATAVNTH